MLLYVVVAVGLVVLFVGLCVSGCVWGASASVLVLNCSLFNSVVDFRYNVACVAAWCLIGLFVFGVTGLVCLVVVGRWCLLLCLVGFALLVFRWLFAC